MTDNLATGEPTLAALYGEPSGLAAVLAAKHGTSRELAQRAIDIYMGAEPGYLESGAVDYDYWDQPDTGSTTKTTDTTKAIGDLTKAAGGFFQTITGGIKGLKTPVVAAPTGAGSGAGTDFTPFIIPALTVGGVLLIMGLKKKARK